jgi:hypothetical protein
MDEKITFVGFCYGCNIDLWSNDEITKKICRDDAEHIFCKACAEKLNEDT